MDTAGIKRLLPCVCAQISEAKEESMSDWKRCPKCECMNLNRESCVDCGLELKDVEAMSTEQDTQRPAPSMEQQGRTAPDLKYTELPPNTQQPKTMVGCASFAEEHNARVDAGLAQKKLYQPEPKQPPTETGAVDVDAYASACMECLRCNAKELCKDEGYLLWDNGLSILREHFKPLTTRITQLEKENERLKGDLNWQNNRNSGYPTKGGFEFYINEEWAGLATAALGADCGWCAALRKHRIDPDDERVRVRRVIEDDAILNKIAAAEARIQELEQKLEAALKLTTENSIQHIRSKT